MYNPMSLGEFISFAYLQPLELTLDKFAHMCETNQASISRLMNNKQDLTIDMACKLETGTGQSAQSWMNIWVAYKTHEAFVVGKSSVRPAITQEQLEYQISSKVPTES